MKKISYNLPEGGGGGHHREKNFVLPVIKDFITFPCHKEIAHSSFIHTIFILVTHNHTRSGGLLYDGFRTISGMLRPLTTLLRMD